MKRQISANVERERVIIEELERLGSRWVPEGTTVDSGLNRKRKRENERMEDGGDGDELRHLRYYDDRKGTFLGLLYVWPYNAYLLTDFFFFPHYSTCSCSTANNSSVKSRILTLANSSYSLSNPIQTRRNPGSFIAGESRVQECPSRCCSLSI